MRWLESRVLTERYGGGGAHVLVAVIVDQALELVDIALSLVHDDLIVDGTSSTLNGGMGAQIEVVLEWMSDISLNKSTREWVVVLISSNRITLLGEETDVVALGADNDSPFDLQSLLAPYIEGSE